MQIDIPTLSDRGKFSPLAAEHAGAQLSRSGSRLTSQREPRISRPPLRRNRAPHRWRRRDLQRCFLIGYVGTTSSRIAPMHWRYGAALFRLRESSSPVLLWVADQPIGSALGNIEGVHGAVRERLWQANEEAKEWALLVEEVAEAAEVRAYGTFSEFERAVGGPGLRDGRLRPSRSNRAP